MLQTEQMRNAQRCKHKIVNWICVQERCSGDDQQSYNISISADPTTNVFTFLLYVSPHHN